MTQLVALIHGILFRSDLPVLKYWGKIPKIINAYGYDVVIINTDALGSVTENVEIAARQLLYILDNHNYDVVHIIGHSKGGVEAIELLRNNILRLRIKTLVLLNSPLRGQKMAVKMVSRFRPSSPVYIILNLIGIIQGDTSPDSYNAFKELAMDHISDLNAYNVRIFVVQGRYPRSKLNFPWNFVSGKSYGPDCEGDGLVEYKVLSDTSIFEIPAQSLTDSILTHNSATGLPRFIVQSHVGISGFWNSLLRCVLQKVDNENAKACKVFNSKIDRRNTLKLSTN